MNGTCDQQERETCNFDPRFHVLSSVLDSNLVTDSGKDISSLRTSGEDRLYLMWRALVLQLGIRKMVSVPLCTADSQRDLWRN